MMLLERAVRAAGTVVTGKQRLWKRKGAEGIRTLGFLGLFLVFVLSLASACAAPTERADGVRFDWAFSPDPPQVGPVTLMLMLKDSTGAPIEGADLRLEGNMSHPGMQPVFAEAHEDSPGVYTAQLEFTMAGDWIILVEGTLPGGRNVRDQIDVRGVRAR
jgi:hypothetical protein